MSPYKHAMIHSNLLSKIEQVNTTGCATLLYTSSAFFVLFRNARFSTENSKETARLNSSEIKPGNIFLRIGGSHKSGRF